MTATAVGALFIILLGAVARRTGLLRPKDGVAMVNIVLYFAMPCLVLLEMVGATLDASLILVPVAGYLVYGVLLGTAFAGSRLLRLDRPGTGALAVATAVGNTGFFGIPLIAASGSGLSVPAAIMYDTFCTTVLTWTSTVALANLFGEGGSEDRRIEWGRLSRNFLLPPTWALAIGLALNGLGVTELPAVIDRPLEIMAAAVLPLVLLYAGLMLDLGDVMRARRPVGFATVARLALGPVIGLGAALALGFSGDVMRTVVLMAAMPTAMMSLVIGGWYRLRTDVIAGAIVTTTVLCTLTLPVIKALL